MRMSLTVLTFLTLATTGCGPKYVRNTEIEYSDDKQELADVIERYRIAVEQRDADALRAMASADYYENGSTTRDPSDDYDYEGLQSVLSDLKGTVKAVKYHTTITAIEILDNQATVDYDYELQFRFLVGERDSWKTRKDKNRMTLQREKGQWRIISGM